MDTFEPLLGYVVDYKFTTHEEMIEAALLWNIQEYQLDNGPYDGYLNVIHTRRFQLADVVRSKGFFVKGEIPANSYVFSSVESEGKMTHNGISVFHDELILLTDNDQVDFVVSGAENDVTIAVDKDFFDNAFKIKFNTAFEYDTINKRIQLKENTDKEFRVSIKKILHELIQNHSKLKNDPEFCEKAEYEILEVMFQYIDISKTRQKTLDSDIQANEVRICIEDDYHKNINLKEICSSKKFSDRTIRLGFNDLFGFPPKKYLTQYRLGKVHHELIKSDPRSETVSSIAYKHGFDHMGRFTQNYKEMFQKTPYQTLKSAYSPDKIKKKLFQ